jgi:hypothetical protein
MKEEILNTAIHQIQHAIGINVRWQNYGALDGLLIFNIEGREITFTAMVKKELRQYQLNELLQLHHQYKNLIIVAENIFPNIKSILKTNQIAYLETNGNMFLQGDGIYYFIHTNKNTPNKKSKANRAFTKTGLKVVFQLLTNKELVNKTQRIIAETTAVALGNIPQVIDGLKATNYLLPLNNKEYVWENRRDLLDRWINKYATELRPKLKKSTYTLKKNWKELILNTEQTVWGGEPAADLLTNHLRPEKLILYTKENQLNLIKNYHLMPKEGGEIEVLEMFWNNKNDKNTAPAILVYADLIIEGGKRNNETAQKIFNEYIEPNL